MSKIITIKNLFLKYTIASTFCIMNLFAENPFNVEVRDLADPISHEISTENYMAIQTQLQELDLWTPISEKYRTECNDQDGIPCKEFHRRCSIGVNAILIDPEKKLFPKKKLIKIGSGGDRCIVSYVTFNSVYPHYLETLIQAMKETQFNGYFLAYFGAWPNPTGDEINYIGTPYSFKIFAMVEAHLMGFNNVLWVDSSAYPLRDVTPIFDIIEKDGALFNSQYFSDKQRFIFPSTRKLLFDMSGVDVLNVPYVMTGSFGMKMDTPDAQRFINKFYEFVAIGSPFLSCYPEEFVMTAILNNGTFPKWINRNSPFLCLASPNGADDSPEEFDLVRQWGVYFYIRKGR